MEHFKEYLYQPFLVRTDNNPLMYIMTTPNLDATGHWWVGALVKINFWLEYQKGWDNTVADVLSQITTRLGPEAVQFILDGVTLGATQRAEGDDPAVVEGDQEIEKEVHVTAGQVPVTMHVTNWATAQREDAKLDVILHWLEAKKKTDLRTLLREHSSSGEGQIVWRNHQNFMVLQDALYLCFTPKGENEDLLLFVVPKAHQTATLMGVIEMQNIKAMTIHYPCYKNVSGGLEWPNRWDQLLGPAHAAFSMRVASLRPLYAL